MKMTSGTIFAQAATAAGPSKPGPAGEASTQSEDRSTAFRPVQGGDQMQSGEKLLVEAYAVIWLLLFAMLFVLWRRQKTTDRRIEGLERSIAGARRAAAAATTARGGEASERGD